MNKQFMGKNIENVIEQEFMDGQVFDYKSFMSCISNTLKKEDEILGNY